MSKYTPEMSSALAAFQDAFDSAKRAKAVVERTRREYNDARDQHQWHRASLLSSRLTHAQERLSWAEARENRTYEDILELERAQEQAYNHSMP